MRVIAALCLVIGSLMAFAHPASASSASFVQGTSAENNGYSITLAYPGPVAAGDLLVAFDRNYDDFGGKLSDTLNGSWTMAVDGCSSWDVIWYRANTAAGPDTVTLTSKQHGYNRLALMEYSGVAGNLVAAASSHGAVKCGTFSKVATSGTTVAVPAGDLAVAGFETGSAKTAVASTSNNGLTGTVREHTVSSVDGAVYATDGTTSAGQASLGLTWSGTPKWWACIAVFS